MVRVPSLAERRNQVTPTELRTNATLRATERRNYQRRFAVGTGRGANSHPRPGVTSAGRAASAMSQHAAP